MFPYKKFFLLSLLLSTCFLFADGVSLGLKGGVNVGFFLGSDIDDFVEDLNDYYEFVLGTSTTSKEGAGIGLNIGSFLKMPFGNFFALQPEVYYKIINKNINTYLDDYIDEISWNEEFHVIEIPILAKVKLFSGSIYAGPRVTYLLNPPEYNISSDTIDPINQKAEAHAAYFNKLVYGAVFGYEYKSNFKGSGFWLFDMRYNHNFTSFYKYWKNLTFSDVSILLGIGMDF